MVRKLDEVFNECLERMQQGESIESCLGSYPEYAIGLQELLRTYLNVRWRSTIAQPRPEFKMQARMQFIAALQRSQQLQQVKQAKPAKRPLFRWQGALVPTIAAVVLMLFSGVGTVAASSNALPDEPLYPVKIATERAREVLTFSDEDKVTLQVALAETRVQEITALANQGKTTYIAKVTDSLASHLEEADLAIKKVEVAEAHQANRSGPMSTTATAPSVAPTAPQPAPIAPRPVPDTSKSTPPPDTSGTGKSGTTQIPESARVEAKRATELRTILQRSISNNVATLEKTLDKASPAAKSALKNAIDVSNVKRHQIDTELDEPDHDPKLPNSGKPQSVNPGSQPVPVVNPQGTHPVPVNPLPPKPAGDDVKTAPNPTTTVNPGDAKSVPNTAVPVTPTPQGNQNNTGVTDTSVK